MIGMVSKGWNGVVGSLARARMRVYIGGVLGKMGLREEVRDEVIGLLVEGVEP